MNQLKWPRYWVPTALGAILVAVLAACGSDPTPAPPAASAAQPAQGAAAPGFTPVTIEGCATTTGSDADIQVGSISYTYEQPPTRAISLNQHAIEIMLALGLEGSMVGTAYLDDQILPQYLQAYGSVPVLAEEYPSKEVILAAEPDFIFGGFSSAFRDDVSGSQDSLKELGIGSYLTSAICAADQPDSLDDVYTDLRNIAAIFGVPERAEAVIDDISSGISAITGKLDLNAEPIRVFMFDSGDDTPFTAVCCSMFSHLIESIGGTNIFGDVEGRWKSVNWEDVIDRDPEVIVLTEAVWSTSEEKLDLLLNNEAYSDITAVKDARFVVLQFSSLVPGIRNAIALEDLAKGIYPDLFP